MGGTGRASRWLRLELVDAAQKGGRVGRLRGIEVDSSTSREKGARQGWRAFDMTASYGRPGGYGENEKATVGL
jgi:hypothetical protein